MDIIVVLVSLLVLGVALYVLNLILDFLIPQMGLPGQVKPIVLAIVGLIFLVLILSRLGVLPGRLL